MIELRISLQPKQRQFLELIENVPITFFGGARGGGKSKALQLIMLLRRLQYQNTSGAIFRRTYPELEANHIRPLFQSFPSLRIYWNESKKLLSLPNGSTIQYSHCNNESDISLYQGREIEDLAIDEIGQWSEGMFRTLLGSNRTSKPGIKPRCFNAGNPGGIGHGWLKRLFIEKRFNDRERDQDYAFIQSLVYDNPALIENDPDYISRLESEPNESLRKAWLYGDWSIFAGQFFQEISRNVHFIKPFEIPRHWNRFGSYDYGFNHPAAFGWFANDEDGNTYLYRELVKPQLRVDQFAAELNKFEDTKLLNPILGGHDCWTTKSVLRDDHQPPTVADEFLKHGIYLEKAIIDRIQGAAQLRSYLAWQGLPGGKPRLYIFDTCPITFDTISRMIHNPDRPEDVLKINATEGDPLSGDDAYDMVRYGLMSRPHISDRLKVHHKSGTPEWAKEQEEKHVQSIVEQIKKEKDLKDGKGGYGSWNKDPKGVPDWYKW